MSYRPLLPLALLAALTLPARASIIDVTTGACPSGSSGTDATACGEFVDLGSQGFGHDPRLLTLQTNGFESGAGTPSGVTGDAVSGADKTNTPPVAVLGWQNGSNVLVGFNSNQSGNTGITLDAMTLTLYNGTTAVGSFSWSQGTETYSAGDLATQQGNGNALFEFKLDATEAAQWTALVQTFGESLTVGMAASLGCQTPSGGGPCVGLVSNDGADSFIAIVNAATATPLPGSLVLMFTGLLGLIGLGRKWAIPL